MDTIVDLKFKYRLNKLKKRTPLKIHKKEIILEKQNFGNT